MNLLNDHFIYTLGFIWADGNVKEKKQKFFSKKKQKESIFLIPNISIEIIKEDMDVLYKNVFSKSEIEWGNIYNRKRNNWKEQSRIINRNKSLFNFLVENNYNIKSSKEPEKILSVIPKEKRYLWWRGYSDGDGCFYISKDLYIFHYSISGPYECSNSCFINILKEIGIQDKNIEKKHTKSKGKNSKWSSVRIHNRNDCTIWGNYIYQNADKDGIGLKRKYEKYLLIKNSKPRKKIVTEKEKKTLSEFRKTRTGSKNENAKKWELTSPNNEIFFIHGELEKFCLEHNLNMRALKSNINSKTVFKQKKLTEVNKNTIGWKLTKI